MRVLIDAGMGSSHLQPLKKLGVDVLILSHCHIDHRLTKREIPDVPVWCHEKEKPYLLNKALYLEATGIKRSGIDIKSLFDFARGIFNAKIRHNLVDGEQIDLGGLTLVTLYTPGHSPGHLAFYIPEHELLFSADVDLTPFGPFYGHDFADIDDYEEVIYRRDRLVLEHLTQPRALEYFRGRNLVFRSYPEFTELIEWFELVHIEKHLKRLSSMGQVKTESGKWIRVDK